IRVLPGFLPVRKPAWIGLAAEDRHIRVMPGGYGKIVIAGTTIEPDRATIQTSRIEHEIGGTVGGIERDGYSMPAPQATQIGQIALVIAITAVFIFQLHHQDRAAAIALQWRDLL